MKKIATLILFAGLALSAMAQNLTLKGTVKDSAGEPIIGAFVVQQGTNNGAMTDVDGAFALTTPQGASIEISCIGYATQVISNNGQQDLSIVLADDAQMLEETVVIGYGVQKKSVVTAAIAKVDAEALGVTAPTRVDNALKGLTAGVTVTSASEGDTLRVNVACGENTNEYRVTVNTVAPARVTVVSPAGTDAALYGPGDKPVSPVNGAYRLIPGEEYSCVTTKNDYFHATSVFTAAGPYPCGL